MLDNIFKKILVIVIVIFIIHFFFFNLVLAQGDTSVKFTPQVGIPGTEFQKGAEIPISNTTAKIGEYIKGFYIFIISALAILSVVMIAWAGITWLTAGGSAEKVGAAKAHILGALGGLALGLLSYVILQTINPDLVSFKTSSIKPVPTENCCQETSDRCSYKSKDECKKINGAIWRESCTCDGKTCVVKGGGIGTNTTCNEILYEEICKMSAGCKWENGKCSIDITAVKCGVTKEEKEQSTESIHCCTTYYSVSDKLQAEYKYARLTLNKDCLEICGLGWARVSLSDCETKLGY